MCDCFYLPTAGFRYFGKNSDRHPEEAQSLRLIPEREPSPETRVGPLSFSVPDLGLALALSCPAWMAGAEMGLNAAGVAIGNEAVFSRFKPDPAAPLGMDYVRAALASSDSAERAVERLIELTERHGQGGVGSYRGRLVYNNCYLVVGPDGAYVLETAARRWAWRRADEATALSNAYALTDDYKRLDAETRKAIAPVNERMACLDEADAGRLGEKGSWKAYVEDRFLSRFTAGDARRRALSGLLPAAAEAGTRAAAMALLRAHAATDPERPGRPRNVCDHDGDIMGNPTTASMLVEYGAERTVLWFTGASYACANIFKPILLASGRFTPLWAEYDYREAAAIPEPGAKGLSRGLGGGAAYWRERRSATRRLWRRPAVADARSGELAAAQAELFAAVDRLPASPGERELAEAREAAGTIVRAWDASA